MVGVYPPREDSLFLSEHVKRHARGHVLDMGTGSGVQLFAALENPSVLTAIAVDIDPAACTSVRERLRWREGDPRPVHVLEGDMFTPLNDQRFDTIICNPPYLPDEPRNVDASLYGGPNGYEFTLRFLDEAQHYLTDNGHVLLLFSSLTNKERVDRSIEELGYAKEELEVLAMFFERLYVYRVWRP